MEKIIFNGALYIKKTPSIKIETRLVMGTFNIDDIKTGRSYTIEKPEDLNKFSDFVVEMAEKGNLIERKEETIYDNTDFYQIYTDGNSFSLINKYLNMGECFISIDELEVKYMSLEDYLNKAVYIGRQLIKGTQTLELIYACQNNYLLRDPISGEYSIIDKNNPTLKGYKIGELLSSYFYKEVVYQEIIKQRLRIYSDNDGQKR